MEFYLLKNEQLEGPFGEAEARSLMESGEPVFSRKQLRSMGYSNSKLESALKKETKKTSKINNIPLQASDSWLSEGPISPIPDEKEAAS